MSRILGYLCPLLFCSGMAQAQLDQGFLRHLSREQLKREHQAYLNTIQLAPDSLAWLQAKYHLQYHEDSLFFVNVYEAGSLFLKDTAACIYASEYFLEKSDTLRFRWFEIMKQQTSSMLCGQLLRIHQLSQHPIPEAADLPDELQTAYRRMWRASRKKPMLAAVMSAIIPGSGKWYAGRRIKGTSALLITGLGSWRAQESVQHLGWQNPMSLLNLSLVATFYVANIYGSYVETRLIKAERTHQFLHEAAAYYRLYYPVGLYP